MKEYSNDVMLGYYIGEYIVDRFLPTLNIDSIGTRKRIIVSEDELTRHENLQETWYQKANDERNFKEHTKEYNKLWNDYRRYANELYEKYLPKVLECYVPQINLDANIEEIKKGISSALWDSDVSHYDCDINKIHLHNDNSIMRFTVVTLHYHSEFKELPE